MSYSTRVYRQRNAHVFDNDANKEQSSFFSRSNDQTASKGGNGSFFQAKLSIGQPNDTYEKEADAVASAVVNHQPGNAPVVQQKKISSIQRLATPLEEEKLSTNDERMKKDKEIQEKPEVQMMCTECENEKERKEAVQTKVAPASGTGEVGTDEKEKEKLQAKGEAATSNTTSPLLNNKIENSSGKGAPLSKKTLSEMNASFGVDFSQVNVHTDSEAVQMNKELGAQAFTHGNDIYFNSGKYNAETAGGKELLAHELTHVVQQGHAKKDNIQRSCNDGSCETCSGGIRDFWITFYFRRRATRRTMTYLRNQINETKRILAKCCLRLKASFNWQLMPGGGHFDPINDPQGNWSYTNDASQLGGGDAFNDSRGIPILVVDTVDDSGGGFTMSHGFNSAYTGRTYAVIGVNQVNPNPACTHLAHELWHVGGGMGHQPADGTLAACHGDEVSAGYCTGLRNVVAPVGDFPSPARHGDTAVA